MGWILLLLIPAVAQGGVIDGTVVNAVTKAPVAGATIRLVRGNKDVQSDRSGIQGEFRIADVPDGEYRVAIHHPEHLPLAEDHPAARTFAISANSPEIRLAAELVPLGQITGRVISPAREAVKGVPVALRRPWDEQWVQITVSGDDGRYHFRNLEPGTWLLAGIPSFRISLPDPKKSPKPIPDPAGEDGQKVRWAATFYPGVLDVASAGKIVLRPGAVLDGYQIMLRAVPVRRLSGVVLDADGNPVPKAFVSLSDLAAKGSNGAMKTADGNGRFEFDAGMEGDWRIFAQLARSGMALKGYVDVHVSRTDLSGIEVRLNAPFPVKGFVEREQPRDQEGKRKVTGVYLIPQGASADVRVSAFHEQDGSFVLNGVYPGSYRVLPVGFVPGYYVASVWYGDQDVTTQAIAVVNPPLPLKVVYRTGAGRVSGTVERGEGAWVVLVPLDEALRDSDQFVRMVKCAAYGQFTIESLRPGRYYAFAFDRVRREMFEDTDFVRNLAPRAVVVDVRHGEAAKCDLVSQVWPDY